MHNVITWYNDVYVRFSLMTMLIHAVNWMQWVSVIGDRASAGNWHVEPFPTDQDYEEPACRSWQVLTLISVFCTFF